MPSVIVPLDDVGPGVHVLGHVGLTQRGFDVLHKALAELALNGTAGETVEANELLTGFLNVQPVT